MRNKKLNKKVERKLKPLQKTLHFLMLVLAMYTVKVRTEKIEKVVPHIN
jgi:hypothetical protein